MDLNIKNISVKYTNDHSKWAVSEKQDVVCFGDLNREKSHKRRTGITACFRDKKVSQLMRNFITNYDHCSEEYSSTIKIDEKRNRKALEFLQEVIETYDV